MSKNDNNEQKMFNIPKKHNINILYSMDKLVKASFERTHQLKNCKYKRVFKEREVL